MILRIDKVAVSVSRCNSSDDIKEILRIQTNKQTPQQTNTPTNKQTKKQKISEKGVLYMYHHHYHHYNQQQRVWDTVVLKHKFTPFFPITVSNWSVNSLKMLYNSLWPSFGVKKFM